VREPVDTNVVLRFLVEDRDDPPPEFAGVFRFFDALERGEVTAMLPSMVLFQTYFVLTSYYKVSRAEAALKLSTLLDLRGLEVPERQVLRGCLYTLIERPVDLVDAYLAALCRSRGNPGVYSYDKGLTALGLSLLAVNDDETQEGIS
jgi:predicted nucleic acid-binding protein